MFRSRVLEFSEQIFEFSRSTTKWYLVEEYNSFHEKVVKEFNLTSG